MCKSVGIGFLKLQNSKKEFCSQIRNDPTNLKPCPLSISVIVYGNIQQLHQHLITVTTCLE